MSTHDIRKQREREHREMSGRRDGVLEKHPHYFKEVLGLEYVDVYRVLSLFRVTDPCFQHAIKKLLCAGQRGGKDLDRDAQEAIDTLLRWQEMRAEDAAREGA